MSINFIFGFIIPGVAIVSLIILGIYNDYKLDKFIENNPEIYTAFLERCQALERLDEMGKQLLGDKWK